MKHLTLIFILLAVKSAQPLFDELFLPPYACPYTCAEVGAVCHLHDICVMTPPEVCLLPFCCPEPLCSAGGFAGVGPYPYGSPYGNPYGSPYAHPMDMYHYY